MLTIKDITSVRGERTLFSQLSFSVSAGKLVQIEGPNGSGKTTLLRMLAGLTRCESGSVYWRDKLIAETKESYYRELLFLGHQVGIKRELTAYENLLFHTQMHAFDKVNKDKLYDVLALVGLAGFEDLPVAQYSAGQQRRVALARLWLSKHPLWILDEPLTAIDKRGVLVLSNLFKRHAEQGGIVIFTTHQDMQLNDDLVTINLGPKKC